MLQEQLEAQTEELKRSVRQRQDLEVEHAALQKQAKQDREEHEDRLVKSQTDQAVANCELEACKKQVFVSDLQVAPSPWRSAELSTVFSQAHHIASAGDGPTADVDGNAAGP